MNPFLQDFARAEALPARCQRRDNHNPAILTSPTRRSLLPWPLVPKRVLPSPAIISFVNILATFIEFGEQMYAIPVETCSIRSLVLSLPFHFFPFLFVWFLAFPFPTYFFPSNHRSDCDLAHGSRGQTRARSTTLQGMTRNKLRHVSLLFDDLEGTFLFTHFMKYPEIELAVT